MKCGLMIVVAVVMSLSASNAMASFSRLDCSNSDASVQKHYSMSAGQPEIVDKWLFKGVKATLLDKVKESDKKVLESKKNNMMMREVYVAKLSLSLKLSRESAEKEGEEVKTISAWFVCTEGRGI